MTSPPISILNQVELLTLALDASKNNNRGGALAYLKEAVSRFDASASAHYLLGAEYAQIQMHDRAIAEMETAVAIDPALATARLQLGLLLLGTGAAQRALDILQPLSTLDANNALRYFGNGLIHLIREELNNATASLQQGIALNIDNPALNSDMQRIIDEIAKLPMEARVHSDQVDGLPDDASARHIFLSAYTSGRTQ